MEETTTTLELADPPSPESLIPGPAVSAWWIAAGVGGILVVALILWRLAKWCRPSGSPAALRDTAFREACAAFDEIGTRDSRQAAVQASLVLRHYLSKACGDPSLFETHEEFVSRHDSLAALSESARSAACSGFEGLARMKYAKESPTVEAGEVLTSGRALLQTLHRGFRS